MSMTMQNSKSPFHAGERQVQKRLGVEGIEAWASKVVRPYLPEQHRAFHTSLPFLIAAARDANARPWVTLLSGADGFITSPDDRSLRIDTRPAPGDALENAFIPGADIGLLGIQPATRRRNRVNGRIAADTSGALVLAVDQSFGNCPQYIRERTHWHVEGNRPGQPRIGTRLSASQVEWIRGADTFFIASGHRGAGENAAFGMDASHRGGEAGFVTVSGETRLGFPDYAGNNHYNTIGNLVVDPRVGMLFVDFKTGSLLQLSGRATIDWSSPAVDRVPGARRLVIIDIERIIELPHALSLRWDSDAESVRSLRLVEKIQESADVMSFVFEARDGDPLPAFKAGQHLPIEFNEPDLASPIRRTYSLSGAPNDARYRISVKREPLGLASRHLHDRVQVGEIISSRAPSGDFVLPENETPIVLISAGIGVTPMLSMLHALSLEDTRRQVWFIHGARDGEHHPLAGEIRDLVDGRPATRGHTVYSKPRDQDLMGVDYDGLGRVDGRLLEDLDIPAEAHYLLCGPVGFMADLQNDLQGQGVSADRIHTETFGPLG